MTHWFAPVNRVRDRRNRGFLGHDSSALTREEDIDRQQVRFGINLNGWNVRIWAVAASGFLTGSYNLFATNVVYTSIAFVYFPDQRWPGLLINATTLVGSIIGQLLFGFLADLFGRSNLYGIELVIIIISTLGLAFSGTGYQSMSFLGLFTFWRFVTGVGLGAEYPLSAVITTEWSSTSARAVMIASVFLMQPVGQALAQFVSAAVLLARDQTHSLQEMRCGLDTKYEYECRSIIDGVWRIVIGVGAAPALLAILFRFFLPDSGLYNLEVRRRAKTALSNNLRVFGEPSTPFRITGGARSISSSDSVSNPAVPLQFSRRDLHQYFIREGNWLYLLGTASTWFILDVALYGFGLDNRSNIADMWATHHKTPIDDKLECWNSSLPDGRSAVPNWVDGLPIWQTDRTQPCNTIYDVLLEQTRQYLLTVSIGSLLGCLFFVFFVNRIPRRQFLTSSFILLTIVFSVTGGVFYAVHYGPYTLVTVVMVGICHFSFNFGANSLTFLIPAEIFPTTYRGFCYGISAAAGKLGSVIAVLMVYGINTSYHSTTKQGLVFLLFAFIGSLGAIYSWAYLPDVQRRVDGVLENRDLEELGEGMVRARMEGQVFTVREKWQALWWRWRRRRKADAVMVPVVVVPPPPPPAEDTTKREIPAEPVREPTPMAELAA